MAETAKNNSSDSPQNPPQLLVPKEVEEWMKALNPALFQNYKDIQSTWQSPIVQFSMTLGADPQFRSAVSEIHSQPNPYQRLATFEIALVVIMWVFKAWRLSKAVSWLQRLWVQFWVGALFWLLSLLVIPYIAWGSAFKTVLGQLVKALIRHFF